MPEPDLAARVAAAGLTVDQVDPDYLCFLKHVRPDWNSFVLELPANGYSPAAHTVKYAEPPNDEAQSASVPSQGREEPPGGEAQSVSVPSPGRAKSNPRMEEVNPSADTPWYDSLANIDVDADYRVFLQHTRVENGCLVLEIEGHVVYYAAGEAQSGGRSKATGEEEEEEDNEVAAFSASEEEARVAVISSDGPFLNVSESRVRDSRAHAQKVEEDQEGKYGAGKDEGKDVAGKDEEGGSIAFSKRIRRGHRHGDPAHVKKIKVEEEENLFNEPAMETLSTVNREKNSSNFHDAEPHIASKMHAAVNREMNSSNCHDVEPQIASGLHGAVWPRHIIERPESDFKERLMHVLSKPFSQGEYDMLVGRATIRNPATKERRTRSGAKYYYCTHVKNKSYFDCYPDLAKQVESTSHRNGLALLRGFFFWLENVGHEDQFRPWRDDFTYYKVIPSTD